MTTVDPIALLDLTSLGDEDTEESVRALCAKARTPRGDVAAVCVWGRFGPVALHAIGADGPAVAVVANFPAGDDDPDGAAREAAGYATEGVPEIDVVVPWRAHLDGDHEAVTRLVGAVRAASDDVVLKAILETGSHPDAATTRAIAEAALAGGADILKTSTGKVGPGASPEAARVLLEAVRDHGRGGVKVSGGVRTAEQAEAYIMLAEEVCGAGWVAPGTFRIGASSLLDDLLARP